MKCIITSTVKRRRPVLKRLQLLRSHSRPLFIQFVPWNERSFHPAFGTNIFPCLAASCCWHEFKAAAVMVDAWSPLHYAAHTHTLLSLLYVLQNTEWNKKKKLYYHRMVVVTVPIYSLFFIASFLGWMDEQRWADWADEPWITQTQRQRTPWYILLMNTIQSAQDTPYSTL